MLRDLEIRRHRDEVDAAGAGARFAADPAAWLPRPARPAGRDRWRIRLHVGPVRKAVEVTVGPVWVTTAKHARTLAWTPVDLPEGIPMSAAMPRLSGELLLRDRDTEVELTLRGSYEPPLGVLGAGLDTVALHHLAAAGAGAFVDEVLAALVDTSVASGA